MNTTYSAANVDGHSFANSGRTFLHARNNHTAAITLTFQTPLQVGGVDVEEVAVQIPVGEERMVGPFAPAVFNQSGAVVYVDFDLITNLTVAAIQVGS